MALDTGVYPANARLILNPTNYRSGGTDLGMIGLGHNAGFGYHATLLSNVKFGEQFTGGRITGINLVYRIILLEQSNTLMSLLFGDTISAQDHFEWFEGYKLGHPVEEVSGMTKKLLIRPTDADHPHLYIPKAFPYQVGPIQWDRRGKVYDSTEILIAALFDETRNTPYHYGNYSNLAAI